MKLIVFVFTAVLFFTGEPVELVSWNSTQFEFGEIQQNIPVTASYELTNESEEALIIENVKVGCGCTSSKFAKEAIRPGETTVIEATFNAKKVGHFTKTVSVQTNLSVEPTVLSFNGTVVK